MLFVDRCHNWNNGQWQQPSESEHTYILVADQLLNCYWCEHNGQRSEQCSSWSGTWYKWYICVSLLITNTTVAKTAWKWGVTARLQEHCDEPAVHLKGEFSPSQPWLLTVSRKGLMTDKSDPEGSTSSQSSHIVLLLWHTNTNISLMSQTSPKPWSWAQ